MGAIFKILAALLVIGGLWIYASGRAVTEPVAPIAVPEGSLVAGAVLAPGAEYRGFDERGTVVIDENEDDAYLLFTTYDAEGNPSVRTKRLVFPGQPECAEKNLSCATNQAIGPVRADEQVRVVGIVQDERVEVHEIYRL